MVKKMPEEDGIAWPTPLTLLFCTNESVMAAEHTVHNLRQLLQVQQPTLQP